MIRIPAHTAAKAGNDPAHPASRPLLTREWLVANGLGGYASGSIAGICTRRYHGLLIAALPAPFGRTVMLSHLLERADLRTGSAMRMSAMEHPDQEPELIESLEEFRLEVGLPVWVFRDGEVELEKRLWMPHGQNTVHVSYRLCRADGPVKLSMRPAVVFRPHEADVARPIDKPFQLVAIGRRYEVCSGSELPPIRMELTAEHGAFVCDGGKIHEFLYRMEQERGYASRGPVYSPGYFEVELRPGEEAVLIASTEPWDAIAAMTPAAAHHAELDRRQRLVAQAHPCARSGPAAELVLAADQFIIHPRTRAADEARARAAGDEARTVIAGYHWFTDWGRDTMISLEGLCIATGRAAEAGYILRTFAHYVRDGLIPNMFPEGEREGLYHTADATLWFFHALDRYLRATDDRQTLEHLLPKLLDIVDHHIRGTRFGIGMDARDALLRQGAEGYQLTWMDAKCDGWVVTPRRGKAVEINALWYNALRLLGGWLHETGREADARRLGELAERARVSFNRRFWYAEGPEGGWLHDVVDVDGVEGRDDPACRPNQVFAISLSNPVLERRWWEPVLDQVRRRLLTPVGLRSLAPGHPDYKPTYHGDLRTRDAAYHQGTVWGYLIGPFVEAWVKTHPEDREGARSLLDGFIPHLSEAGIGTISEVFDAEAPFTPRGCIAQAWSVAEVLRSLVLTARS
jgi:predicted glycogen debranching enzyme